MTTENYKMYVYNQLLPAIWFKNYAGNSMDGSTNGHDTTGWENFLYSHPQYILEIILRARALTRSNKSTHVWNFLKNWYANYTDMPVDTRIRMALAAYLVKVTMGPCVNDPASQLTLLNKLVSILIVFREIIFSIAAAAAMFFIIEPSKVIIAPFFYAIWRPTYMLGYKAHSNKATIHELNQIENISFGSSCKDYFEFGLVMPFYRTLQKILRGCFELIYVVFSTYGDVKSAWEMPAKFNAEINPGQKSVGNSKTISDSENTITSKKPLLVAFSSFSSSMRGMLFNSRTMLFHRLGGSDSSMEASPTAKRKSVFEYENGDSPRPHTVSL